MHVSAPHAAVLLLPHCPPQSAMGGKSAARLIHKHNENNPNNYPM